MQTIRATLAAFAAAFVLFAVAAAQDSFALGEPRDDLERFYGVYGNPDDPNRTFFVTKAVQPAWAEQAPPIPDGYLMIGAMWGDVSPWAMRSLSETRFEQGWVNPGVEAIVAAFELDADGNPIALTFETMFVEFGRLERLGELPDGF